MGPINVYLDNSDLSGLFKAHTDELLSLKNDLLSLKANGAAVYSFSFWHIVEFIQKPAPGYEREHHAKATFLQELCDENALPHYLDVLANRANLGSRPIWIPRETVDRLSIDLVASFRSAVDKKEGLNREQRRKLKSTRLSRRLFDGAYNLEQYSAELPLSEKFKAEQTLTKFVRGEISERNFAERLAELFCSPPVFYEEWYKDTRRAGLLTNVAGELGQKLVTALQQASSVVPKLHEIRQDMLRAKKSYYDEKRKFRERHGSYPTVDEAIFKNIPTFTVDDMLSGIVVDSRLTYIKHYFSQAIKHNKYKENDAVDLMHLFYTPDVDLMRCDRVMYSLMKHCPHWETSKLVPTLAELPSRIAELHSRPQQTTTGNPLDGQ